MIKVNVETEKGKTILSDGKIEGKPWEIATDIECIVCAIIEACKSHAITYGFLKHEFGFLFDDEEEVEQDTKEDEEMVDLLRDALKELKELKKGEKK